MRTSRREFIQKVVYRAMSLLAICISLPACTGEQNTASKDPCDLSQLNASDQQARQSFSYVIPSPFSDMECRNCKLWIRPHAGAACGGCVLLKGPVHPSAYCSAWVPEEGK